MNQRPTLPPITMAKITSLIVRPLETRVTKSATPGAYEIHHNQ